MSLFFNVSPAYFAQAVLAYLVSYSLRFDGSADYLTRSQTTPTDPKKWTWSGWVKLSTDSTDQQELLGAGPSNDQSHVQFISNRFGFRKYTTTEDISIYAQPTFTDTSVWNHFVIAYDSTEATASNRAKIWANGQPQSLTYYNGITAATYPDLNEVMSLNKAGESHYIGRRAHSADYWFDGQLAEVHFIDGTAYDQTYFGETRNGVWVPKEVTGINYGNNGFYLDYKGNGTGVTLLLDGSSKTADVAGLATISATSGITKTTASPDAYGVTGGAVLESTDDDQGITASGTNLFTLNEDFTLEAWVKINSETTNDTLFRIGNNTYASLFGHAPSGGTWKLWLPNAGDTNFGTIGVTLFTGLTAGSGWHHIALTKSGTTFRGFVDGVQTSADIVDATTFPIGNGNLKIGLGNGSAGNGYGIDGQWQDVRYTKGIARYSGSFTPPDSALINTPEYLGDFGVDRSTDGTGVTLLLDGSSDTTDVTGVPTITNPNSDVSTTATDPGSHPYATNFLSFDNTAGAIARAKLVVANDESVNFGNDDFTIEAWIYRAAGEGGTNGAIFSSRNVSGGAGPMVHFNGSGQLALYYGASRIAGSTVLAAETWYHIALTVKDNIARLFLDGIQEGSDWDSTTNSFTPQTTFDIGHEIYSGVQQDFYGYMTDIRITRGVARYTDSFTPPTSALSADVSGITGSDDVVLLLDGSSDTTDASGNQTISETGNVTPVTATGHPYATSSLDFDTSVTSYLRTGITNDFKFGTGPFTIEFWMKPDTLNTSASNASYSTIIENESGSTYTGSWFVVNQINGEIYFAVNSGATSITTSSAGISTTSWSHVAIVRHSSNTCTIYVDGVSKGSATISQNLTDVNSRTLVIGKQLSVARRYDGQLTDIRIAKGAALYPQQSPTSALTNDDTWDKPKNDFSVEGNITPDDQLLDTPNLRFATWDPVNSGSTAQFREGNLLVDHGETDTAISTMGSSAKFYAEMYYKIGAYFMPEVRSAIGASLYAGYWSGDGNAYNTNTAYGDSFGTGSIIGVAVDANTGTVWFSKNGVWQNGATASGIAAGTDTNYARTGLTGTLYLASSDGTGDDVGTEIIANFGQDHTFAGAKSTLLTPYSDANGNGEFYYQPPSGFLALAEIEKTKVNTVQRWNGLIGNSVARRTTGDKVIEHSGIITTSEHYQSKL